MGKLLIDERPLTVLPSLVAVVGMERAVILQQIHWLLQIAKGGIDHDGEHWVWGSYEEWCEEYFPFWSAESLRKHIVKLEKEGFVISAQIKGFDRRKAYRIDQKKIAKIESPMREHVTASKRKNFHPPMREDVTGSKREDVTGSIQEHVTTSKPEDVTASYIKTTTETTTKTTAKTSSSSARAVEQNLTKTQDDDDDDFQTREPFAAAWLETYAEPMPEEIARAIASNLDHCSDDAIVHAIRVSVKAKERTFKYIKTCAENYIPPAPAQPPAASSYTVDLPTPQRDAPNPPPPPDPDPAPPLTGLAALWPTALAELRPVLNGSFGWLEQSTVEATDRIQNGKPVYRVLVTDARGVDWLTRQASAAIARTLSGLLKQPVAIEIEPIPPTPIQESEEV